MKMVESGEKWGIGKMLIGNYTNKVSQKGRTAVPASFRKKLGKKVVITKGFEGSLFLVSQGNWQKVVTGVESEGFLLSPSREAQRFILGNAFKVDLDAQGRLVIPQALRDFAQIQKNAVFVGVGNRVEVWDEKKWQKHQNYLKENVEKIVDSLNRESA